MAAERSSQEQSRLILPPHLQDARRAPLKFRTLLVIWLGILTLEIVGWSLLRLATVPLRRDVSLALAVAKTRIATRVSDAAGMLPSFTGRLYQIQSAMQNDPGSSELYASTLSFFRNRHGQAPVPSNFWDAELLDLCFNGDEEQRELEKWLVPRLWFPEHVYKHLERNYFMLAQRSERTGEIQTAKRLYRRFADLTRMLARESAISLRTEVQRKLTVAETRARVLSARHSFRHEALRELDFGRADLISKYLEDRDPSIRAIAVLTYAGSLYRQGEYSGCVEFLNARLARCGVLFAECSFTLLKARARHGRRAQNANERNDLVMAQKSFAELTRSLEPDHYLIDDSHLWWALTADWIGDRARALRLLNELPARFPNTDLTYVADAMRWRMERGRIESAQ